AAISTLSLHDALPISVMGPSGCGKSTLLHLLGGLERPDAGEIVLGGRRVDGMSETAWAVLRRRMIGFVFQAFNLVDELTAVENRSEEHTSELQSLTNI